MSKGALKTQEPRRYRREGTKFHGSSFFLFFYFFRSSVPPLAVKVHLCLTVLKHTQVEGGKSSSAGKWKRAREPEQSSCFTEKEKNPGSEIQVALETRRQKIFLEKLKV
jgi:hypothetical protein